MTDQLNKGRGSICSCLIASSVFECLELAKIPKETIIYYPVTKLAFDGEMNFLGTGKLVNDYYGMSVEITKY